MENKNKPALEFLLSLIDYYTDRKKCLESFMDQSYIAFVECLVVRSVLNQLKLLHYKLTNKEIDNEPK